MSNQGTLFEIEKIEEKKSNNEKSKKGTIWN